MSQGCTNIDQSLSNIFLLELQPKPLDTKAKEDYSVQNFDQIKICQRQLWKSIPGINHKEVIFTQSKSDQIGESKSIEILVSYHGNPKMLYLDFIASSQFLIHSRTKCNNYKLEKPIKGEKIEKKAWQVCKSAPYSTFFNNCHHRTGELLKKLRIYPQWLQLANG